MLQLQIVGHLEAAHRQQIIDIQREIEQQAIQRRDDNDRNGPQMPPKIINSSTVRELNTTIFTFLSFHLFLRELKNFECPCPKIGDPVAYYSQQIIDLQREIERQAVQRREDQLPDSYTPHMPPRLNSTVTRKLIVNLAFRVRNNY